MHLLVESDAVRLVLGFLNERQRLRFLATSKALAPWRKKRRDAASDAFEKLQAQSALFFRTKKKHPNGRVAHFYTHSIQRCPVDAGLLLVHTSMSGMLWNGVMHHHDPFDRHFSPSAAAFVCTDEDEDDRRVDDDDAFATLSAVSERVF